MSETATSAYSRVFLIDGGARPDHTPEYQSCGRAGAADQSFGDVENVECPDPANYGQFKVKGTLRGAKSRATMDITSRYLRDVASAMLEIARQGCRVDAQVHIGACTNPSDFDTFQKALIFEDALFSNWSTGDLGALSSDENASVDEVGAISAADMYEVLPLNLAEGAQSIITNEVLDVVICDTQACGECDVESDGCQHIYAISTAAGGSPSTPADIIFSIDGGANWYADDVDSLGAAEAPTAIGCLGDYIVVVSNDSCSLHYALKSEVDDVDYDETWVETDTGFEAGGCPNDCWNHGNYLFICGDGGYVYVSTDDPSTGVSVLDAGEATDERLQAIHAMSDELAIAGGASGALVYTEDRTSWQATNDTPFGIGEDILCVWMHSENVWFVGGDNGEVWYTTDQGDNWTLVADYGAAVYDIAFATDSVGYLAFQTAALAGGIRRTYDGGHEWKILPEGVGTIAANDRINAIAACEHDPNFVVGVGLNAADGFLVVGSD